MPTTKNIFFTLALLPTLIIAQTTHGMELPSQKLSLCIRLKKLPTEIQTHILGYVLGNKNGNWCTIAQYTIPPHNRAEIEKLIKYEQTAPYRYDNHAQRSVLAYTSSSSYKAKIINKADKNIPEDAIMNGSTPINTSQCHPKLDLLAISTKYIDALYIFKKTDHNTLIAILNSTGNKIAFHPTEPILASTSERTIDILHVGKAIGDQTRFNFPDKSPACTIVSLEKPDRQYHSANYIQSISFDQTGNFLKVISGNGAIDTFTCYKGWTFDQLILKNIIATTLKVEKPNKNIKSMTELLTIAAPFFEAKSSTLQKQWSKLPLEAQNHLWNNAYNFIQKHGKIPVIIENNAPKLKITENELALIMGGCTIQ